MERSLFQAGPALKSLSKMTDRNERQAAWRLAFPADLWYAVSMEIKDMQARIEELEKQNKELTEDRQRLQEENARLRQSYDNLLEQIRLAKKKQFGSSSEKLTKEELEEQLSLFFNEAEFILAEEVKEQQVKAHTRKKKEFTLDKLPEGMPVEVVEHYPEDTVCPDCGTEMECIGKEVKRTLVAQPQRFYVREDHYFTYACSKCRNEGIEVPIVKAEKEASVIPGSFASPELLAHLMTQKFCMMLPLYRQEQELGRMGIPLSRQTMSNWMVRGSQDWLSPIYDVLHRQLLERDVLHADETTLQVLQEPGKKAQSKSYMWLYRTSGDAEHPIVLYEYKPDRKAENAEQFLEGFSGWLHADGYQGYHRLPENIRVVGCWAHARRKFDEAVASLPTQEQPGSAALKGQRYCNELFALEQEWKNLTPEERYTKRQEKAKPILDALLAWAKSKNAAPKSALGKALYYLQEQWPYLIRYLEDGRLELSNNRAERSIKPFVMGRKNWLFANTPAGAQSSAVIYSLMETAKENGLDPYSYLTWVFRQAPVLSGTDPHWAEKLTPEHAPQECRTPTILS